MTAGAAKLRLKSTSPRPIAFPETLSRQIVVVSRGSLPPTIAAGGRSRRPRPAPSCSETGGGCAASALEPLPAYWVTPSARV
jgi:hypothetical protein